MTKSKGKWYQKASGYDRDSNEPTYKTDYSVVAFVTTLIPAIILITLSLVLFINWTVCVGVPVRREFTTYITSADDMYDPHVIIQTLKQAIQGIEDLGLKPNDNAAIFSWNKNYKHTPQFSIDQIKSVIAYANSFIEWKESSYESAVIEVAADVYDEKVRHLRAIVDDIDTRTIETAYCLKTPGCLWYAYGSTLILMGVVTLLVAVIFGMVWADT